MADPQHHIARIVAPSRPAPLRQLLREVFGRLPGQRRIAGPVAFAPLAMAGRTGGQAAIRIAGMIQCQRDCRSSRARWHRHLREVDGYRADLPLIKLLGDPCHLRMLATPIGIGDHLPFEIAGIKACQSRCSSAVAQAVQPVAGNTGIARACSRSRQGDQLAGGGEAVGGRRLHLRASAEQEEEGGVRDGVAVHPGSTAAPARLFRALLAILLLVPAAACKGEPQDQHEMPLADAARGRAAALQAGCGACHVLPGIAWPQGSLGPPLHGFADRSLIAGKLPNRPAVLAAYIRNAPALVPGSAMPAMPVSAGAARDIAAYLYQSEQK